MVQCHQKTYNTDDRVSEIERSHTEILLHQITPNSVAFAKNFDDLIYAEFWQDHQKRENTKVHELKLITCMHFKKKNVHKSRQSLQACQVGQPKLDIRQSRINGVIWYFPMSAGLKMEDRSTWYAVILNTDNEPGNLTLVKMNTMSIGFHGISDNSGLIFVPKH